MTRIAIVGAGFSGTLLALHLLRRCPPDVQVSLIERSPQFGRGAAYATGNPSHLLNVPAGRMSAFHDRPGDFVAWLREQQDLNLCGPTENSFVPRRLYGAYVRHLLNDELKRGGKDRLELVRGDALQLQGLGPELVVRFDHRRPVRADLAVLAVGNFPPEPPPVADPAFYDTPAYRPDPWAADSFADLEPDQPILLIGTGLTMVDAVITLLDQGHRGPIHALSRRGLLPQRHQPCRDPSARCEPVPTSLVALTRFMRREVQRAEQEGSAWQPIVDALRPFTLDVWESMTTADRARFLRHLRPWWEIHRHRTAPAVAERIDAALARGQLRIHAGKIRRYEDGPGGVRVCYRVRGSDEVRQVEAVRVVNCAGPGADYGRIRHPLIRDLLGQGLVRPDPLHLGLDVTSNGALKNRAGAIPGTLFAVGPITKGAYWEMTAVPDIRRQCERLATHLAMLAASRRVAPVGAA